MQALIDVIIPVFLVIGFGFIVAWKGLFEETAVNGVMKFAQNFAIPMLLFRSMASLDLTRSYDPGLLVSFYAGAFGCYALGHLGAKYLFNRPATDCVAIGFCCLFSNSLLLGIPITERAYGTEALAGNFTIISIHSPMLYAFGIMMMEIARNRGQGMPGNKLVLQVIRGVLRTPLVIGVICGITVNLLSIPLPSPLTAAIDMMVRAGVPTALFALGGVLYRYRPEGDMKAIAMVTFLSLIVHPGIAYLLGRFAFGLSVDHMRSLVVTAAMAPGANAYLFANMFGAARRVAASSVLMATALSILTVWAWLGLLP